MVVYFASQYKEKIVGLLREHWEKFVKLLREYKIEHVLIIGDDIHKLEDISIGAKKLTEQGYYDYILFQTTTVRGVDGKQYRSIEISLNIRDTHLFLFTNEEWEKYGISEKLWEWVKELFVGNANRL